jgi:hypothetical protein
VARASEGRSSRPTVSVLPVFFVLPQCVQGLTSPNPGAPVSDAQCSDVPAPSTQQTCPTTPTPCPVDWKTGEWGLCSQACGGGSQARSIVCAQTQNGQQSEVNAQFCKTAAPPAIQECNTVACADKHWSYSLWSPCSAECGDSGTQTRTAVCATADGKAYDDSSLCTDTQEPLKQACNTMPCSVRQTRGSKGGPSGGRCCITAARFVAHFYFLLCAFVPVVFFFPLLSSITLGL